MHKAACISHSAAFAETSANLRPDALQRQKKECKKKFLLFLLSYLRHNKYSVASVAIEWPRPKTVIRMIEDSIMQDPTG